MATMERNEEIVIIGAGMAGLSAAEHLYRNGFRKVTLLEAKNRYGGRIWSENFGKNREDFIELGAQFVGGLTQQCSIYILGNQIGLKYNLNAPDEAPRSTSKGHVVSSDGHIIEPYIIEKVNELFDDWWEDMEYVVKSTTMEKSLRDYLEKKVLPEFEKDEQDDVRSYFNYFRNWLRLMEGIAPEDFDIYDDDWENGEEDLPEPTVEALGRLDSLNKEVASRFPAEWIKLSTPVTNVKWGAEKSQVTCSVLGGEQTFAADHVIVTCPLGFLKKNHGRLFEPALPKPKVEAIDQIPFGAIGKIFLQYEAPFWEENLPELTIAWTDDDFKGDFHKNWVRRISHFEKAHNSSNVLIAWITCEGAEMIEKLSEEEVARGCTKLLRKLTRNPSIPDPLRILKSSWITDPYTLGVYSCKGFSNNKQREALAAPLVVKGVPRVLFAGEATDKKFPGYMHGARDTGLRAAVKLIKLYNKKSKKETNSKL